jgi:hypothetical protein
MPDTLPPQAAQAANAIRDAWLKCDPCDGYGYFSDGHPNDPDSGSYPCSACGGEGVRPGGVQDWRDALELWTFTDGDEDAKAEALAERYDDELIDAIRRAGEAYFQASPELQALARALS